MKEINDGGRAFPRAALDVWGKTVDKHSGLSKRDYFAAKAMQAVIANGVENFKILEGEKPSQMIARQAYTMADAMIAEGSK